MNRSTFNAMLAQYSKDESSGDGSVSWENGAHCIIPEVKIRGKAEQAQYKGVNLWNATVDFSTGVAFESGIRYDQETQTYEIPAREGGFYATLLSVFTFKEPIPAGSPVTIRIEFDSGYIKGSFALGGYHYINPISWQGEVTIPTLTDLTGKVISRSTVTTASVTDLLIFLNNPVYVEETVRFRVLYTIGEYIGAWEPYTSGIPAPNPNYPIMPTFSEGTKVVSRGKNLLNMYGTVYIGRYSGGIPFISSNMQVVTTWPYTVHDNGSAGICCVIPCFKGVTYTLSLTDTADTNKRIGVAIYPTIEAAVSMHNHIHSVTDWITLKTITITSPVDGVLVCMLAGRYASSDYNITYKQNEMLMLELGPTATPYKPFFDGGEAVAPELLAIPGTKYQDEWDARTGKGVHRVGKQVFHESDGWALSGYSTKSYNAFYPNIGMPGVGHTAFNLNCTSSHFLQKKPTPYVDDGGVVAGLGNIYAYFFVSKELSPDVESFKAFIANQREAGNPLTVWYALPEPIPFQTDPQPLIQPTGVGQLIQIDGTLDNCPITVTPVTHQ